MSRMQEALSREEYDHANPAVPVAVMLEADVSQRSETRPHDAGRGKTDRGRLSRSDILWIVRHSMRRVDHRVVGKPELPQQLKVQEGKTYKPRKRTAARAVSVPRHDTTTVEPAETKRVTLDAQIRSFQERADLRECRLPGMLSKISPKACEGWQRQATVRTSRIMANMKLDACRNCPYRLAPEPAEV